MRRYCLIVSGLIFCSLAMAQPPQQDGGLSGKQLYRQMCAACHGVDFDGKGPLASAVFPAPANLNQHVPEHAFMGIMHSIMHGDGAMPSWRGTLTHDEAFSIVEYLQKEINKVD